LGQSDRQKTNGHINVERPNQWQNFPTQPPVCGGDDGIPTQLDGIAFSKWRAESIKGYGNAIVPQIASQLFEIIQELNENN
jgi:DNA (cytosine-5)-methyltransferase 1